MVSKDGANLFAAYLRQESSRNHLLSHEANAPTATTLWWRAADHRNDAGIVGGRGRSTAASSWMVVENAFNATALETLSRTPHRRFSAADSGGYLARWPRISQEYERSNALHYARRNISRRRGGLQALALRAAEINGLGVAPKDSSDQR